MIANHPSMRRDYLITLIVEVLSDLSGATISEADSSSSFLELGFDSLFLTQASQVLQRKFGVKVTFRDLLDTAGSPQSLATLLDNKLSPEKFNPSDPKLLAPTEQSTEAVVEIAEALPAAVSKETSTTATISQTPISPVSAHGPMRPIDKSGKSTFSVRQRKHVDRLVKAYESKTAGSKRYTVEHRSHLADPRVVAGFKQDWKEIVYPIVASSSSGSRIVDVDGNEYVDVTMGFGVNLFGHNPDFVRRAVEHQLRVGIEIGPQSSLAGDVSSMICRMTGMDRAAFCNTGSEAVMGAVRIARTVTGRNKVVYFNGDYHGMHDEVLLRPNNTATRLKSVPIAPGIPQSTAEQTVILGYGDPESLDVIRADGDDIAAVLVEPVQSRNPSLQPQEFLTLLRELTTELGICLIFDEVITGFRSHPGGAQAVFNIKADLATYGKVIGGGMPFGVIAGSREYMDALDGGAWNYGDASFPEIGVTFFAGTFVRHPLALAAAEAVLKHLEVYGPELQHVLNERTAAFVSDVNSHFEAVGAPLHLPTFASQFYIHFDTDIKWSSLLWFHLREKGVHIWEGRPCFLSTAHTEDDIEFLKWAFKSSVAELQEGGFIPGFTQGRLEQPTLREVSQLEEVAPSRMYEVDECEDLLQEIVPELPDIILPLTEQQQEIWLATRMAPTVTRAFDESLTLKLRGELDLRALQCALDILVQRHEAFRTTFSADGLVQRIKSSGKLVPVFVDLVQLSDTEKVDAVLDMQLRESAQEFDLENGPLFSIVIAKTAVDEHLLSITGHHIVLDGWSFDIVLNELSDLYSSMLTGQPHELPTPALFSEYALSRTAETAQMEKSDNERYWLQQLHGQIPSLTLPADHVRQSAPTYAGATQTLVVSEKLLTKLNAFAASNKCTLYAVLLASWAVVLRRLSSADDLVVGVPAAGQQLVENSCLVGHCVSLLPIRFKNSLREPFLTHLAATKELVLDAYEHQDCTFGSLLAKLHIEREHGKTPLISTTFNVDTYPSGLNMKGLSVQVSTNPRSYYQFELGLNIVKLSNELTIEANHNSELYEPATVLSWLRHYVTFLEAVVSEPGTSSGSVPLLGVDETETLLQTWNQTSSEYDRQASVSQIFEQQVTQTPDAIAVVLGKEQLTYSALNMAANQTACLLQQSGVVPGTIVGLFCDRSIEIITSMLAILKLGAAYLPLDPGQPDARSRKLIVDSNAAAIVTHSRYFKRLSNFGRKVVAVDEVQERTLTMPGVDLPRASSGEDPAYIMFTSGSTGMPKGVVVPNRAIVRLVKATDYMELGPDQTFLQLAPVSFDASTLEIWGSLLNGGRLVIMPPGQFTLRDIADIIGAQKINTLWLTAGLFHSFIASYPNALSNITQLLAGGDVLSVTHIASALSALPNTQIINGYGPTENTTFSCCHHIDREDTERSSIPIGRPVANSTAYVLDEQRQLVPIGVVGELYVGGDGVAIGYLNDPELTSEKFVENPFSEDPKARLYRTGDRARWLPSGLLEYHGRIDQQLKIRGFRVEPAEIEAALNSLPFVQNSVVIARSAGESGKQLNAYITLSPGTDAPIAAEIKAALSELLPVHMVPSHFHIIDSIPLTENGKPDRRRLALLDDTATVVVTPDVVKPRDETESALLSIWQKYLPAKTYGINESFWDIGGDSLIAVRIFVDIESQFGRRLPLPTLFSAPTIALLAGIIRGPLSNVTWNSLVAIRTSGTLPPLYCVHPIGGGVACYRELAKYLPDNRPVWGLQSQGLDGIQQPVMDVAEMASNYIREIVEANPEGPYLLCGHSFGGIVAYEMAAQLRMAGKRVDFVGLVDTYWPEYSRIELNSGADRPVSLHILDLIGILVKLKGTDRKTFVVRKFRDFLKRLRITKDVTDWEDEQIETPTESIKAVTKANEQALVDYYPDSYQGTINVFRAKKRIALDFDDPLKDWERVADHTVFREVPGNHFTVIREPYVANLSRELASSIQDAATSDAPGA